MLHYFWNSIDITKYQKTPINTASSVVDTNGDCDVDTVTDTDVGTAAAHGDNTMDDSNDISETKPMGTNHTLP